MQNDHLYNDHKGWEVWRRPLSDLTILETAPHSGLKSKFRHLGLVNEADNLSFFQYFFEEYYPSVKVKS